MKVNDLIPIGNARYKVTATNSNHKYKAILSKYQLFGSMSRKGDFWDNAVAESFFATIKKEYIYQTTFKTRIDAQLGIFDYIEAWYNTDRIHSHLDHVSPNEFESAYWHKKAKVNQVGVHGSYLESGI